MNKRSKYLFPSPATASDFWLPQASRLVARMQVARIPGLRLHEDNTLKRADIRAAVKLFVAKFFSLTAEV
ncbi:MAG: hypothetical protein ACHQIM_06990 [Sphingobacteriales bacterium]